MKSKHLSIVMPALLTGTTSFLRYLSKQGVDGRDKPDHDAE